MVQACLYWCLFEVILFLILCVFEGQFLNKQDLVFEVKLQINCGLVSLVFGYCDCCCDGGKTKSTPSLGFRLRLEFDKNSNLPVGDVFHCRIFLN